MMTMQKYDTTEMTWTDFIMDDETLSKRHTLVFYLVQNDWKR